MLAAIFKVDFRPQICKLKMKLSVGNSAQCTTHKRHMSYYAAMALTTSARRLYQHWTNLVILAEHWLWLPDDDFFVNRNMLEQPP